MPLEAELALFEKNRPEWIKDHEGQFVLIKGQTFAFYETDEEAYQAAVETYGNDDVFIKQVLPKDQVENSLSLLYGLVNVQ